MKEYLTKNSSGNYQLVNHRFSEDDIEVPKGAEILTIISNDKVFYKSGNPFKWFDTNTEKWRECSSAVDFDGFENKLWQRSLNDKVASAEVARQELKGVDATLAERQSQYGGFVGVANTTGQLMDIIKSSPNGHTMPYAHEEALHMICSKMARIVNGDFNHLDSWHDIGGYAKLIEDLIKEAS